MKRFLVVSSVALAAALTLTACSTSSEPETKTHPTAVSSQPPAATPQTTEEPADESYPALPDVAPAAGAAGTNGSITVTLPEGWAASEEFDGVQFWDGPAIPESASPDGSTLSAAGAQLYPAEDSTWDGTILTTENERSTSAAYSLDVPGADVAAVEVHDITEGKELDAGEGITIWDGPQTRATILVVVNGQLSRVTVTTNPGQAGLEQVAAIARSITVN